MLRWCRAGAGAGSYAVGMLQLCRCRCQELRRGRGRVLRRGECCGSVCRGFGGKGCGCT
jgi:hypothetical protein